MTSPLTPELRAHVDSLLATGRRQIVGLIGAPGSGKSTFSQALLESYPGQVCIVPMDGFHLANSELARLGRAERKGAQDTFDSAGFVALLRRLRHQPADETVYAPEFHREIEEAIAGAIAVEPTMPLIVTEGLYLLIDHGHCAQIRGLLDEAWYVDIDDALRRERLVARHMRYGRSRQAAEDWVAHTDEPNAVLVAATKVRADRIVVAPR